MFRSVNTPSAKLKGTVGVGHINISGVNISDSNNKCIDVPLCTPHAEHYTYQLKTASNAYRCRGEKKKTLHSKRKSWEKNTFLGRSSEFRHKRQGGHL